MNALPLQIFQDIQSPRQAVIDRAWGAALTLVVLVLIFNLIARAFSRRSRMAMIPPQTTSQEESEMSTSGGHRTKRRRPRIVPGSASARAPGTAFRSGI
jgi:hypothetical protein